MGILKIFSFLFFFETYALKLSLDGSGWKFRSPDNNFTGYANVPGDIYTDLFKSGLIGNPLIGNGDQEYLWVGRSSWIYERIFNLDMPNAFNHKYCPNICPNLYLKEDQNNLTIVFESPVEYSKSLASAYNMTNYHILPYDCLDPVYMGECHVNFLRKTQSSFSWNWGPTFATVGIAASAYIEYFNDVAIYQVAPLITKNDAQNYFQIQADVLLFCHNTITITLLLNITEINLTTSQNFTISCTSGVLTNVSQIFNVPENSVLNWYPNGYGDQKLYTLITQVLINGLIASQNAKSIGFRTVELIQDFLDNNNTSLGRHFYFKINGIPVFLKGSNFIPIDSFPAQNFSLRKKFLFESMKQANINALRIWGGGLFERNEFYELADMYGIMLWHDHMYACNLYPVDEGFFDLIRPEIANQVIRLRHHPSIIIWAGNNENEAAIINEWTGIAIKGYSKTSQEEDYIKLYYSTMLPIVQQYDPSRPFVLSSPSNGIETEQEGGISVKISPYSQVYGDIHYYAYKGNLWNSSVLPIPRCATEFGSSRSIPLNTTMADWVDLDQWTYGGFLMTMRDHYADGQFQNLDFLFQHFEIPYECDGYTPSTLLNCSYAMNSTLFLNDFAYMSQVFQAISIQTEVEHFRRHRSLFNMTDGRGGTMCALFWMLNDVWAAPTKASIDYNLNWKVLHYYVKKIFAPVIVSMYIDSQNDLQVFIVNDRLYSINDHNLKLDVFKWESGLTPVFSVNQQVNVLSANATQIDIQNQLNAAHITLDNNDGFVIRAYLYNKTTNSTLTPNAILLPDKLKQISNPNYGDPTIQSIIQIDNTTFNITISSSKLVPFVWLDIKPEIKKKYQILYWFSDNGFTMTVTEMIVELKIFSSNGTVTLKMEDMTIMRLKMASNPNGGQISSSSSRSSSTSSINPNQTTTIPYQTTTKNQTSPTRKHDIFVIFMWLIVIKMLL